MIVSYLKFSRPFTLLAPAIGMVGWGLVAIGGQPRIEPSGRIVTNLVLGALMAAFLNAASNGINQIYDVEIDRINKPHRALPSGKITRAGAFRFTVFFYALAVATAAAMNFATMIIVLFTCFVTYAYSAPPFRTKRWGILANITIAIPRGVLLPVAGWCAVVGLGANDEIAGKGVFSAEIWYLAAMSGLFILGAATTKDYADIEGDRAEGCSTLPIRYGVKRSVWMTAPSLVVPFLMLPLGVRLGILTGHPTALILLGWGLAAWGTYTAWLLVRDPDALTTGSEHPSWRHMYLLMVGSQVGVAVAYVIT